MAHVRVFGSKVMEHVPMPKCKKWDAKSYECILTGFDEDTKAYRLWDPKSKKILKSRDVTFISEAGEKSLSSHSMQSAAPDRKVVRLDLVDPFPVPEVPELETTEAINDEDDFQEPVEEHASSSENEAFVDPISDVTSVDNFAGPRPSETQQGLAARCQLTAGGDTRGGLKGEHRAEQGKTCCSRLHSKVWYGL